MGSAWEVLTWKSSTPIMQPGEYICVAFATRRSPHLLLVAEPSSSSPTSSQAPPSAMITSPGAKDLSSMRLAMPSSCSSTSTGLASSSCSCSLAWSCGKGARKRPSIRAISPRASSAELSGFSALQVASVLLPRSSRSSHRTSASPTSAATSMRPRALSVDSSCSSGSAPFCSNKRCICFSCGPTAAKTMFMPCTCSDLTSVLIAFAAVESSATTCSKSMITSVACSCCIRRSPRWEICSEAPKKR
mmetsp:Transcript_26181/g.35711  ORF Transcript_26181/g.35711 Transcript_26181/m.35711 type:complete len:246 (-) Transcript_26181:1221-1958(-)